MRQKEENNIKDVPGLELIEENEVKQDGGTIIDVLDNKDDSRVFVELGSKESRKLLTHEVIERKGNGYYHITIDFIKFLVERNLFDKFLETVTSDQIGWEQRELFRNIHVLWFEEKYKYNSRLLQLED